MAIHNIHPQVLFEELSDAAQAGLIGLGGGAIGGTTGAYVGLKNQNQ